MRLCGSSVEVALPKIKRSVPSGLQEAMAEPVDMMVMACKDPSCDFKPMKMQRRPVGDEDVLIDMVYCGLVERFRCSPWSAKLGNSEDDRLSVTHLRLTCAGCQSESVGKRTAHAIRMPSEAEFATRTCTLQQITWQAGHLTYTPYHILLLASVLECFISTGILPTVYPCVPGHELVGVLLGFKDGL